MSITVAKLKAQLKQNVIGNLYMFCGEEKFLRDSYLKLIEKSVVDETFAYFNSMFLNEDNADYDTFIAFVESYPQMADKKLIVLKNTEFLKSTEYQKDMIKLLENIPEYTVIVFVEDDISKIKKDILAVINKLGITVDFAKQMPSDLRAWVNKKFSVSNKKMRIEDMEYLVDICERSLGKLQIECDKLIASVGEEQVITRPDIDKMVQVPTEYKVFTMADKLLEQDANAAYSLLKEFKNNKEQPTVIIALIYSQLASLLMFKNLGVEKVNADEYLPANRRFLAKKLSLSSTKHSNNKLRNGMKICAEFDIGIKTGKIEGYTALEIIMAKLLTEK